MLQIPTSCGTQQYFLYTKLSSTAATFRPIYILLSRIDFVSPLVLRPSNIIQTHSIHSLSDGLFRSGHRILHSKYISPNNLIIMAGFGRFVCSLRGVSRTHTPTRKSSPCERRQDISPIAATSNDVCLFVIMRIRLWQPCSSTLDN